MKPTLRYLFLIFLKIGATSWGGFMALVAVVQKQLCGQDKTIEQDEVVRALSLASVLPGPMAVNVVAYIGYKLKGIAGALVSMLAVLLPSFILIIALSYVYFTYGNIPAFNHFFTGVLPAVAAVVASVAFGMGQKNIKDLPCILIAIAALVAALFLHAAFTTIAIILVSAIAGYLLYHKKMAVTTNVIKAHQFYPDKSKLFVYASGIVFVLIVAVYLHFFVVAQNAGLRLLESIAFTFSGLSITQFGGGYVVVPAMQKLIVDSLHWLTQQQFADAIAMGQITPGPIYISAAFIGYKLSGIAGATIATLAMFLPAAMLMIFCAKFLNSISSAALVIAAFKGIGAAVTGMITAAAFTMLITTKAAIVPVFFIFSITLFLSVKNKLSPVYLIPLAGIAGILIF